MNILRRIAAGIIGAVFAALVVQNWVPVLVQVWPGTVWQTVLPVLMGIAFAAGALPIWLWATARHYQLSRRAAHAETRLTSAIGPGAIETP